MMGRRSIAVVALVGCLAGWPALAQETSPLRILLVGDSTVTDDQGWGRGFKARWDDRVTCVNLARNGRSSRSYMDEGHWKAALGERARYVLIQFGHNDQPGKGPERETDPSTSYRQMLFRYVDDARAAGMTPVLVTSLTRRAFDNTGHIVSDLWPYADAAAAVAASRQVPLIDLHRLSIALIDRIGPEGAGAFGLLKPDYSYDATHLSERGSEVFGETVAAELVRLVPDLAMHVRTPAIAWRQCLSQGAAWFNGPEASRVGHHVLLYQRATGGWPKDRDMARVLDADQQTALASARTNTDSTIDNGATTSQVRFLAGLFRATGRNEYRDGVLAGLDFLLTAQYPNGGWPQFYPVRTDYSRHVTFNDDATVSALRILRDVAAGADPFGFVDTGRRQRAAAAVSRGIDVILATQVRVNGVLTAWAPQYDAITLAPAAARTFEPIALSASESVGIATFLTEVPEPPPAVRAAIEGFVSWARAVRLEGLSVLARFDARSPRGWDRVVVADPGAAALWGRFYEIGTNRPLFSDRDTVVKYRLDEIGYERRTGYAWYGTWPTAFLEKTYLEWKGRR